MDRFHENGDGDEPRAHVQVEGLLLVSNFGIADLAEDLGIKQTDPPVYGVIVHGSPLGEEDLVVKLSFGITGTLAGVLAGKLLRAASQRCDEDFMAGFMVSCVESVEESRQHVSQFLDHDGQVG
jgi:hypothetical protein